MKKIVSGETDHIFALSSIVKNRINNDKATFAAFIDLQKAFDMVDRDLLALKLLKIGITGNFYSAVKALYEKTEVCIRVNGYLTDWFSNILGVRQGDGLSPTLFSLYINDLLTDIKNASCGVDIDGENVSVLAYADDIVVLSDSPHKLERMLEILDSWCNKWKLKINGAKSQVVHFRKKHVKQSTHDFSLQGSRVTYANTYKYLGMLFDAHLSFENGVETLATASGRALGSLINKHKTLKDMHFNTYTSLYNTGVVPVMDYASEIWGCSTFSKPNVIQNRAMRYFMGVHRFAPTAAVVADMGWINCNDRWALAILRYWNRLMSMGDNRLTKRIFKWDYNLRKHNWTAYVKNILSSVGLAHHFDNFTHVNLDQLKSLILEQANEKWKIGVLAKPKLRTYMHLKHNIKSEEYLLTHISRSQRSLLAQLRCGILPLRIETGRYVGEEPNQRLCTMCNNNEIEDESHFILNCNFYQDDRKTLLHDICIEDFTNSYDILKFLMSKKIRLLARFLESAYKQRKSVMYN